MEQLTENRKAALIELARRGVGGEKENAISLCKRYGIDWQSGNNSSSKVEVMVDEPGGYEHWNTHDWRAVNYGAQIDYLPTEALRLFMDIAENYTIDLIKRVTGNSEIFTHEVYTQSLYFYCTWQQRRLVGSIMAKELPPLIEGLYSAYIAKIDNLNPIAGADKLSGGHPGSKFIPVG